MKLQIVMIAASTVLLFSGCSLFTDNLDQDDRSGEYGRSNKQSIQLGPRPFFLVENMNESRLKEKLESCSTDQFYRTDFSIGHRGAPMQFPEHTRESYLAAARMGAGTIECDVTFTRDRVLVCRHSQCDLHTSTDILKTKLADKCSVPPKVVEDVLLNAGDIKCCTSDITVAEFKTLKGKMNAGNKNATTVNGYLNATADWRTDLYSGNGTLMTHQESIQLFSELGVKMTPELKKPSVEMPFEGKYSQQKFAQEMINEYKNAGIKPHNVWVQSFEKQDILYWIKNEPDFGHQAVFLDDDYREKSSRDLEYFRALKAEGINIIAPPMWMLLDVDESGVIKPSDYGINAKDAGLDIITWTFERTDTSNGTEGDWYYTDIQSVVENDGDKYKVLHVLASKVGILAIFSDWPATVTYYANCMGIR
jgi:glycerophosphoryl diester phosphodiesterase